MPLVAICQSTLEAGFWFSKIQPSMVTAESSRLPASGTVTIDPGVPYDTPAKLKPSSTSPGAKLTWFPNVPLLPLAISMALPSAGHQLTNPEGGGAQDAVTAKALLRV